MTKDEALRMAMRWITDVSTNNEVEVLNAIDEALEPTVAEWQSLSDDEITSLEYDHVSYETFDEGEYGTEINIYTKEFARAVEAKLKEKNDAN